MKKIRTKIETWDQGRSFMDDLSKKLDVEITEGVDGMLVAETDQFKITCHFDSREFSFVLAKIQDESLVSTVNELLEKYPTL